MLGATVAGHRYRHRHWWALPSLATATAISRCYRRWPPPLALANTAAIFDATAIGKCPYNWRCFCLKEWEAGVGAWAVVQKKGNDIILACTHPHHWQAPCHWQQCVCPSFGRLSHSAHSVTVHSRGLLQCMVPSRSRRTIGAVARMHAQLSTESYQTDY